MGRDVIADVSAPSAGGFPTGEPLGTPRGYRLVRPPVAAIAPVALDGAQRAVAGHTEGPLLVLGAPGTGKTTVLAESVAARVAAGTPPDRVLVLTFGRRLANRLRRHLDRRLAPLVTAAAAPRAEAGAGDGDPAAPRTALAASGAAPGATGAAGIAVSTVEPVVRTFHGYAFGLLRAAAVRRGEPEPRLLSGPEQDLAIREMLAAGVADEEYSAGWPAELRPALRTRGFAEQLRDLLLRAAERGVPPDRLAGWGERLGRPDWLAAARFADQYADVLALRAAAAHGAAGYGTTGYDPAELIRAAIDLLRDDTELLAAERARFQHRYVDELHDTDPAQLELLELLAGDGAHLVAFGDPDSSTFAFRGADPAGVHDFPDRFRTATRAPAPTVTLYTGWRSTAALTAATRRVAARLPGPVTHRIVQPAPPRVATAATPGAPGTGAAPGAATSAAGATVGDHGAADAAVEVRLFAAGTQEGAYLAHRLREAHLLRGLAWSDMAVVVRSTVRQLAGLRRALTSAGVPVRVDAEDLPLSAQPAVAPLLALLRCALRPELLDEPAAVALLHSPLGGADPFAERQLRQGLRALALPAGDRRPSGVLLLSALRRPVELAALEARWAAPARRIAGLLAAARRAARRPDATAVDVLWAVWSGSGLAERWAAAAGAGGARGAAADRDLDAVVALFDAAGRYADRIPGAGAEAFVEQLAAQEVPADSLAPTAERGDAVRILTAHAAKGRQWELVAIPGVQEGGWPDLRLRGSLLGSELLVDLVAGRTGTEGSTPLAAVTSGQRAALLDDERRLFYVAVTRARQRLLVTAVVGGEAEEQPSRFLAELAGRYPGGLEDGDELPVAGRLPRALTLPALVAELRTVVSDEGAGEGRRRAAARQLARLAAAGVPGAHPDTWWGLPELSDGRPLAGAGETVEVSPSTVEQVRRCGVRWVLERHGGANPPTPEQNVGTLVHAAAAESGELDELHRYLDEHWDEVEFPARWLVGRRRREADDMLDRLAGWLAGNPRKLVATEHRFRTRLPDVPGQPAVELTGAVDRLELDDAGRPVIVDLKTGKTAPTDDAAAVHPQLAAYQVAAAHDAFVDQPGVDPGAEPGGAALVQLGLSRKGAREQRQPALSEADDPGWAEDMVHDAARAMAANTFQAVVNDHCRMCAVRTSCPLNAKGRQVTE